MLGNWRFGRLFGLVDPGLVGQVQGLGQGVAGGEAFGMRGAGLLQDLTAVFGDGAVAAVVDVGRGVQPDPGVVVAVVVPVHEIPHENVRRSQIREVVREDGEYFAVLNHASLKGLSLLTLGRE